MAARGIPQPDSWTDILPDEFPYPERTTRPISWFTSHPYFGAHIPQIWGPEREDRAHGVGRNEVLQPHRSAACVRRIQENMVVHPSAQPLCSDPRDAAAILELSRATYRKMIQNLWCGGVPATISQYWPGAFRRSFGLSQAVMGRWFSKV